MDKNESRWNHPAHYQGSNGIECIDIIRHYTCDIANALKYLMRAGKKKEMGMSEREKEIEDCRKAIWYIDDYHQYMPKLLLSHYRREDRMEIIFKKVTGYEISDVLEGYSVFIKNAMDDLLRIGLVDEHGKVLSCYTADMRLSLAVNTINQYIDNLILEDL